MKANIWARSTLTWRPYPEKLVWSLVFFSPSWKQSMRRRKDTSPELWSYALINFQMLRVSKNCQSLCQHDIMGWFQTACVFTGFFYLFVEGEFLNSLMSCFTLALTTIRPDFCMHYATVINFNHLDVWLLFAVFCFEFEGPRLNLLLELDNS